MSYEVKCCSMADVTQEFYTFPLGCRVSGGTVTRRENLVHIPFADGTKDSSDGKLDTGSVTVSGRISGASGALALVIIDVMEGALFDLADAFFICQDYGSYRRFYPVHSCKSMAHTLVEGTGGLWIDIECTFSRGPVPEIVTTPA